MEKIAVDGLTLTPQGIVSGGSVVITSVPSVKNFAEGNGMYETPLTFTFSGGNATGYDPGTVVTAGPGSIPASAVKVKKVSGPVIMREGDSAPAIDMTGLISGTPTPFTEPWEITDAGQTKVEAE